MKTDYRNDFARQAEDFLRSANDMRMPDSMQQLAEDSVAKTREACSKMTVAAQDAHRTLTEVTGLASEGARTIGEKVLANVAANTSAAFDAAEAMARSKTLPEALKVQTAFMQSQMTKAGEQTRELYELSTKLFQQTLASMNAASSRSLASTKTVN